MNARPQPSTPPAPKPVDPEALKQQRRILIAAVAIVVAVLLAVVFLAYLLLFQFDAVFTEKIRDVFIIFMALESLIVGAAMVVLVIQLASLINLLNNEIRPMLDATNETINTLRGTTAFLSENLVEPVMKLNSYLAGIQRLLEMVGLKRK